MAKYTKITTNDGSNTYYNQTVDETYHSRTGAVEEAIYKHVVPSELLERADEKKDIVIADVCFGLGYNSYYAIVQLLEQNKKCNITLHCFENDPAILEIAKELFDEKNPLEVFMKKLLAPPYNATTKIEDITITAKIHVGDVTQTIHFIDNFTADIVFFDPFSPKKHPTLWSKEIFSEMYRILKENGTLTTYSCARMARDNMKKAGFKVFDGPKVGRRSPSTICKKTSDKSKIYKKKRP
ncbi:MAG: tRNA (5-methylaminomethyl-2-thiouridine)(34)-methyltransferase MnmD [Nanobdellota archaeon]